MFKLFIFVQNFHLAMAAPILQETLYNKRDCAYVCSFYIARCTIGPTELKFGMEDHGFSGEESINISVRYHHPQDQGP